MGSLGKAVAATCVAAAISTSVQAAPFRVVGFNKNAMTAQDMGSLRREGDIVQVWELQSFAVPRVIVDKPYDRTMVLVAYNCTAHQARRRQAAFYLNTEVAASDPDTSWSDWQSVVPETVGELALAHACGERPSWVDKDFPAIMPMIEEWKDVLKNLERQ